MRIGQALAAYLEEQFRNQGDDVALSPDDDLVELGLDSIAYVRLVSHIKKTYGIQVPDSDLTLDQFGTLGSITDYLTRRGAS